MTKTLLQRTLSDPVSTWPDFNRSIHHSLSLTIIGKGHTISLTIIGIRLTNYHSLTIIGIDYTKVKLNGRFNQMSCNKIDTFIYKHCNFVLKTHLTNCLDEELTIVVKQFASHIGGMTPTLCPYGGIGQRGPCCKRISA